MNSRDKTEWLAADELFFLRHLGTHRMGPYMPRSQNSRHVTDTDRLPMWRAYRDQMADRVRWGRIDGTVVMRELNRLIVDAETQLRARARQCNGH